MDEVARDVGRVTRLDADGRRPTGDGRRGSFTKFSVDRLATEALNEMAGYDTAVGATYREILDALAARLTVVVQEGQDNGFIRREPSADIAASALAWMAERTCQQNLPSRRRPTTPSWPRP